MITSTIGRIFLDAYNEKMGTDYDAITFFNEVYHPLFFGSNKYLQWVQNSPFVQMSKGQKVETLTPKERTEKLQDLHNKINNGFKDASVAIGFPASEEKEFATTSGQVTNLDFPIEKDDIYLSWIGSSLGIGLQGGLSILFSDKEILYTLYEGWLHYRKTLSANDELRGNQINTWNGQWLAHRFDEILYDEENPMANFSPFETKNGVVSIAVQSWTKVLIGISKSFNNPQMMGYVYNLGQTNTTIGFIPFNLNQIRRPVELYKQLFGMDNGRKAEELWGTEYGFRTSCQKGIIGIEAMKPKGLKQYMDGNTPKPATKEEQQINYNVYQIWLLAMLNNQELWDKSQEFAKELYHYACSGKNGKTGNSRKVDEVKSSINKKQFIEAVAAIMPDIDNVDGVVKLVELVNLMPTDNVPYFLTLLRFHYAALENNSKK